MNFILSCVIAVSGGSLFGYLLVNQAKIFKSAIDLKKMGFEERYQRAKEVFLNDEILCRENKELFDEYFSWQERKLKSINNLRMLDEACYKTLYHYICMFKNLVKWFNNKPLMEITKDDIKQVYEDLEDGKILNSYGKPFEDSRTVSKVFFQFVRIFVHKSA